MAVTSKRDFMSGTREVKKFGPFSIRAKIKMQIHHEFENLIDLFNKSLSKIKSLDKQCLEIIRTEREEKLTYEQLKTRAQDFALWLIQARDIRIKDKVAILGKNRADWDVALWGVVLAGAVPVLIDPERPVEGVKNHVIHTEARMIVMADDYQDADSRQQLKEWTSGQGLGLIEMTSYEKSSSDNIQTSACPPDEPCPPYKTLDGRALLSEISTKIKADDTAVILCTSGTTGNPREVELTGANLIANLAGTVQKIRITDKDVLGHILPPHHSFGFTVGKLLPFWAGATNVYTDKYRWISELIRDKNITLFIAIPALFTVLAKKIEENLDKQKEEKPLVRLLDRYFPKLVGKSIVKNQGWTRLRFFLSGAAPMPRWVLNVFWRRGLKLYEGYGTTENSPVYGYNDKPEKLGSVGKPIDTLLVKTVNKRNETLQPFEKGEIVLGGPCIMKGYYKNPQATEAVIETDNNGIRWLHTGDLGYLDEDGNLFITGRKKYVIVLPGGKKVNPELVESALSEAQYVKDILVVPGFWKDSAGITQEAVKAIVHPAWDVIESQANLSHSDLVKQPQVLKNLIWQNINECQQKSRQLSHFEKVSSSHLEIKIDEFQKTSTGKIKREIYTKV